MTPISLPACVGEQEQELVLDNSAFASNQTCQSASLDQVF